MIYYNNYTFIVSLLIYISLESISTLSETPCPKSTCMWSIHLEFCLWPASDSISMYTVCLILGSLFAACYAAVCHFHHMLAIWLHSCVPVFLPVQGMMTNIWPHTVSPLTIDNIMWQLWFRCSCAGTHVAGHIDSISRLKELCDQHNMWLHLQGYGAVGDCRL